eukprot:1015063-Amphidinium_carterae.1
MQGQQSHTKQWKNERNRADTPWECTNCAPLQRTHIDLSLKKVLELLNEDLCNPLVKPSAGCNWVGTNKSNMNPL